MVRGQYAVKPVLRGHPWEKDNVALLVRWPLNRASNFWNLIFYDKTRKMWPFKTGDCLIEMTTRADFTVHATRLSCYNHLLANFVRRQNTFW